MEAGAKAAWKFAMESARAAADPSVWPLIEATFGDWDSLSEAQRRHYRELARAVVNAYQLDGTGC